MHWLFKAARRLKQAGILGMNRRNANYILDHNPRSRFPIVDDKLRMRDLCQRIGVPTPTVYTAIRSYAQLRNLRALLCEREDFVIKPNRGSAGRGILVVVDRDGDQFLRHNGERLGFEHLRQHLSDILSGMYSLGGRPDEAIIQQRVRLHPTFEPITYKGIPDIRVIVYRNVPAMAMLRLPTKASNGRANLHQGGIGTGVDLATGLTHHAVLCNRACELHPDTGVPVVGMRVPYWKQVLEMSRRAAEAIRLGYVGIDMIVDADEGPMLLEANARPGLAIQIANGKGLVPRLAEIDAELDQPAEVEEEVAVPVVAGRIGVDTELRRRSA
ncbi:MAG TPA: alpha-L-glutamate ligase-like protein [Gemmataceae bacterium]|nr:alpha-L-glutamate ligase-like protein [Gemmataceae bacterium]